MQKPRQIFAADDSPSSLRLGESSRCSLSRALFFVDEINEEYYGEGECLRHDFLPVRESW